MVEVKITLPDELAREAEESGLLTGDTLEAMVREALRRRRVDRLFETMDRLADVGLPRMTEAEIEAEIQKARGQRRSTDASGG
jgi:hypothetical protein